MVGTWHFMWNTLGQRSQHSRLPPLIQTAHQSSLGSSSFLPPVASPLFSTFPLVSREFKSFTLFLVDTEEKEVAVLVEDDDVEALVPFSLEQGASDSGSVLMRSPRPLWASWPVDTSPIGLSSGLLICGEKHTQKHYNKSLRGVQTSSRQKWLDFIL